MQIVIDIPDQIYEMVMNTGTYGCYRFNSSKAIREGTPLDKIRAEIGQLPSYVAKFAGGSFAIHIDKEGILQIINKHMAESEDTE